MMFYTQLFTSKRGPLAKIWLAAHWERKITKAHVFECNLESTIQDIMSPQTDMPVEGLEATHKAITLIEDFTDFDSQLPDADSIGVVDHFSLNQCRTEDITLKEDFGNSFLTLEDFGDETQSHQGGILDISFQSLAQKGDAFGDEEADYNILDFMATSSEHDVWTDFIPAEPLVLPVTAPMDVNQEGRPETPATSVAMKDDSPVLNETTLLINEDEFFALDPVAVTPSSEQRKRRRRRLVVDQAKELSSQTIRMQLTDCSDVTTQLDIAPPTRQLMQWKESGGVDSLFSHPCSTVIHPHLQRLYFRNVFRRKTDHVGYEDEREEMRDQRRGVETDVSALPSEPSVLDETGDPQRMGHNVGFSPLDHNDIPSDNVWDTVNDVSRFEVSHPGLPSEDSIQDRETPSTVARNTQSMVDSQDDFEERRMTSRAQKLLNAFQVQRSSGGSTKFSLQTLCERNSRSQAAATFFCFLVLKKQQALELHQSEPYADIIATPGSKFCKM
ncbi:double-strand-break repair protein rad21-like protein 1 isoform X2 [Esox lucius]|uniref:double-strand-break repair protein rad21-like protein 1 isoform X2 n=1 Tax=Esox lucius TaxID=8010 RepID=UPI0009732CE4|nr:double-strand-break repair protein rad21-like protein 1 isoform X2 [Esox lucius]